MPRNFGVCPATTNFLRPVVFSKSAKNFAKKCSKIARGAHFLLQNVVLYECNKKNLSEINFMCMNFIRLRGLPAEILSGRNNWLLRCYMEFCVRAKTKFSYTKSLVFLCLIKNQKKTIKKNVFLHFFYEKMDFFFVER